MLIVRDMLLKSIYAFFLGWPIYFGVRRILRPALVEEPRGRGAAQPTVLGALATMYLRSDERGPQMNNRMALRIAMFGGVALALFVVLFFRLWFLQILNGDEYLAEANNNRTREFRVSAPRGKILDRNGERAGRQPGQPRPPGQPAEAARRRSEEARRARSSSPN